MKKVLAMALALVMCVSFATVAFAQSEPDEWAKEEVSYDAASFLETAMSQGIDYKKEITREEFAVVALYIYASMSNMEIPEMSVENPFTDCNNPFVVTAYGLGLVKGVSETEFSPEASLTREQMCVMLMRIAEKMFPQFNIEAIKAYLPALDSFADGASVSEYAVDYVKMTVMAGLIKGTDEGKINPQGNLTTQEALIVAKRAMNIEF